MDIKARPTAKNPSLFFIQGHGTSIPNNYRFYYTYNYRTYYTYISPTITLKRNQYIIMYKERKALSGSEWIQEILWKKIAYSENAHQFIHNIREIKKDTGEEYFQYYGFHNKESTCPNLQIFTENDNYDSHYVERFGIFSAPISVNQEYMEDLLSKKNKSLPSNYDHTYRLVSYIPNYNISFNKKCLSNYHKQWDLLNVSKLSPPNNGKTQLPPLEFPIYYVPESHYDFLHEFVNALGDLPFILFCNLCRNTEELYTYPDNILGNELSILEQQFTPFSFSASAPPFNPAQTPVLAPAPTPAQDSAQVLAPAQDPTSQKAEFKKYLKYKNKYLKLKNSL